MLSANCPIILLWHFKTPKQPDVQGCEFKAAPCTIRCQGAIFLKMTTQITNFDRM